MSKFYKVLFILIFFVFSFYNISFAGTTYLNINDSGYTVDLGTPKYSSISNYFPDYTYQYLLKDNSNSNFYLFNTNWEMCVSINEDGSVVFRPIYTTFNNYSDVNINFINSNECRYYYNTSTVSFSEDNSVIYFNQYHSYIFTFSYSDTYSIRTFTDGFEVYSSPFDINIYDVDTNILTDEVYSYKNNICPGINYPYITNSEDVLSTGNFDYLCINSGDFVDENFQDFYLLTYNYISDNTDVSSIYPRKEILISGGTNNKYYTNTYDGSYIYMISSSELGLNFENGYKYGFKLATKKQDTFDGETFEYYDYFYETIFFVGELSEEDKKQNSLDNINSQLDEQKELLEEQKETSKNIFEKIGDIFTSIIELPGKLVNLLIEGLKALFIPSDGFFSDYFDELNDWFSDRLGFLYYPFELIFDILDRFLNINFETPVINIPEIKEPFTNKTLINSQEFNFNTLLENNTLKTVHDIYLILADAFIYVALILLLYKKYEEVIMK